MWSAVAQPYLAEAVSKRQDSGPASRCQNISERH